MFLKLLQLEIKSFFRSPQFGAGLLMKIGMFFLLVYFAMIFFGGAFLVFFGAKEEGVNPLKLFSQYFILYWFADLLMKYFLQQLPTNNIKPLLTLNISKNLITGYTLVKILLSFFSWAFLLFIIPFTILLLLDGSYNTIATISISATTVFLVFLNTFVNTIINKNNTLMYSVFGVIALTAALHYTEVFNLIDFSETIFYSFYTFPWLVAIPLFLLIGTVFITFNFIKRNLYLDQGLEMRKTAGKTENIAYLNRFGTMGTFINNDIRLIKRSKAARGALMASIFFLFYGFFFTQIKNSDIMAFVPGFFITGGFLLMFGQRVPAWDSSYYPLMMTQNVPYKEYLKAKWALIVIVTALSIILAVFYGFVKGWDYYFTIFAAGLYNIGVNAYLTLLAGAFNKKGMDLNSSTKGFAGGQNNFNFKILLIIIPQFILPLAIFSIAKIFIGLTAAVIIIAIVGLLGFFMRDTVFDMIVKIYKTEKYSTISAFKKND